jgi:hypothetical protein
LLILFLIKTTSICDTFLINLLSVLEQNLIKFAFKILNKMAIVKTVFTAFLLLIFSTLATAQTVGLTIDKLKTPVLTSRGTPQYKRVFLTSLGSKDVDNQGVSFNKPKQIPSIFSVEALPFFCKIEYKMGLNKKLPVKFRLGDVQYVDELEGKH